MFHRPWGRASHMRPSGGCYGPLIATKLCMCAHPLSHDSGNQPLLSGTRLDALRADYLAGSAELVVTSATSPRRRASARATSGKAALTSMRPARM